MQLFEEKEYWEVFAKDSRNRKAEGGNARRNNYKEAARRLRKIDERNQAAEEAKPFTEDSTDEENQTHMRKYTNGKVRKEPKVQTTYFQDEEQEIELRTKKKAKGQ